MTRGVRHHLGARALAKNQHELVEDEAVVHVSELLPARGGWRHRSSSAAPCPLLLQLGRSLGRVRRDEGV